MTEAGLFCLNTDYLSLRLCRRCDIIVIIYYIVAGLIMKVIEIKNICKSYAASPDPMGRLRGAFGGGQRFNALSGISLSVEKGETVGIVGRNGSGKSTLLKILAGISEPDSGICKVGGSVSAILELGVGFNPEYSGIENIYLYGALNGVSRSETKEHIGEVLEFAQLGGDFASMPVKTYSSGMLVRLAFAAAIWLDSDIILVDEALAVGDVRFRAKCIKKFEELKAQGKTIIFVSHDADTVRRFCSRAVWIDGGRIFADGNVGEVTSRYIESCVSRGAEYSSCLNRWGSHPGSVRAVRISKAEYEIGEEVCVEIETDIPLSADLAHCGVCLSIKDVYGLDLCVFRTGTELRHGENIVRFKFENRLNAGEYLISVGVENRAELPISYYEYVESAERMVSRAGAQERFGLVVIDSSIEVCAEPAEQISEHCIKAEREK